MVKKAKSAKGGEYCEYISPNPSVGKLYSKTKAEQHGFAGLKNEAAQQLQLEMPRVPHGPLAAAAAMMVVSAARC